MQEDGGDLGKHCPLAEDAVCHVTIRCSPPNPQVIPSRSSPVVPCKLGLIRLFPTRIGRVRMGSCILDPVPPHSSELSCARPLCQSPSGFGGRGTDTSRRHVERGFLCLYCPQAQGLPGVPVSAPNSSSQALQ